MKFAQMIDAAIPALRRYARALTRDRDIADDIVQDTLVRALRSEHLFQGADVRAWLYTILTNLNRNRLRSLARRPPLSPISRKTTLRTLPDQNSVVAMLGARSLRLPRINAARCCCGHLGIRRIARSPRYKPLPSGR